MHIGVDPGLSGAVAGLTRDGTLEALHDTPTLTLRTSRGSWQEYDVPGLVALLAPYSGSQAHVIIGEWFSESGRAVLSRPTGRGPLGLDRVG